MRRISVTFLNVLESNAWNGLFTSYHFYSISLTLLQDRYNNRLRHLDQMAKNKIEMLAKNLDVGKIGTTAYLALICTTDTADYKCKMYYVLCELKMTSEPAMPRSSRPGKAGECKL